MCGEIIPEGRYICYNCEYSFGGDDMGARGMVSGRKEKVFGTTSVEESQNKKKQKLDKLSKLKGKKK